MKKILIIIFVLITITIPVSAMDYTAPPAPDSVQDLMPVHSESFGHDLWTILKKAIAEVRPGFAQAATSSLSVIAVVMLVSVLRLLPGSSAKTVELAGALAIALLLLSGANSMITLGVDTVKSLSEYGKLLLPVLTAALAAQGAATSSAALYAGTAAFDAILSAVISRLLVPMVYLFLILAIAYTATGEGMLKKIKDSVKGLMGWGLKTVIYIFTGYLGITGVVSGSADASALKAAKLTISGMVPMVGGILSDASEAVIVGAGVMKSAVGIYGLLAVFAIWVSPFLQLGAQYLLLKLTAAACESFSVKPASELVNAFSGAMGLLLGMTGSVCFLLLVSTVCFMKGVG